MNKNVILEFVSLLSDDDLRFLLSRLTEKLQGDIAESLEFLCHYKAIDALLVVAKTADEVYFICDQIAEVVQKECRKKGISINKP